MLAPSCATGRGYGRVMPTADIDVIKLLFWRGPKSPEDDKVIDPTREAQRLKGSQAAANAPQNAARNVSTTNPGTR